MDGVVVSSSRRPTAGTCHSHGRPADINGRFTFRNVTRTSLDFRNHQPAISAAFGSELRSEMFASDSSPSSQTEYYRQLCIHLLLPSAASWDPPRAGIPLGQSGANFPNTRKQQGRWRARLREKTLQAGICRLPLNGGCRTSAGRLQTGQAPEYKIFLRTSRKRPALHLNLWTPAVEGGRFRHMDCSVGFSQAATLLAPPLLSASTPILEMKTFADIYLSPERILFGIWHGGEVALPTMTYLIPFRFTLGGPPPASSPLSSIDEYRGTDVYLSQGAGYLRPNRGATLPALDKGVLRDSWRTKLGDACRPQTPHHVATGMAWRGVLWPPPPPFGRFILTVAGSVGDRWAGERSSSASGRLYSKRARGVWDPHVREDVIPPLLTVDLPPVRSMRSSVAPVKFQFRDSAGH